MDNVFIKKDELNEWIAKYFKRNLISIDDMLNVIEDLDGEVEDWKMKYEELQNDLEDNYRPISQAEQYEVSDRDFY